MNNLGIEGMYLHTMKATYDKLAANTYQMEKGENISSRSQERQGCHFYNAYST
jgi:hypothetical protein